MLPGCVNQRTTAWDRWELHRLRTCLPIQTNIFWTSYFDCENRVNMQLSYIQPRREWGILKKLSLCYPGSPAMIFDTCSFGDTLSLYSRSMAHCGAILCTHHCPPTSYSSPITLNILNCTEIVLIRDWRSWHILRTWLSNLVIWNLLAARPLSKFVQIVLFRWQTGPRWSCWWSHRPRSVAKVILCCFHLLISWFWMCW